LNRDKNFQKPLQKHQNQPNVPKKNQKHGNQSKLSDFDEELNNLKARSGIFTNKKNKKPQVITLTPSILTSKILKVPIDVSQSKIDTELVERNEEYIQSNETQTGNRFHALQEIDPASFKFALQPSVLSKYIPGSTIDESDL
jgi:hypothetical protein